MTLLEGVSQSADYPTIWSVVYNLSVGSLHVAVGRDYGQVYEDTLAAPDTGNR
jgi:hypothetical protein